MWTHIVDLLTGNRLERETETMRFEASPEDFLKGQLANPGWHPAEITDYEELESKRRPDSPSDWQPSSYVKMTFKIVAGDNRGQVKYQNFSEKAGSMIVPLLEALGATINKKERMSFDASADKFKGKRVDIHIIRGSWNNKPKDEIDGFRKYTGPENTGAAPE